MSISLTRVTLRYYYSAYICFSRFFEMSARDAIKTLSLSNAPHETYSMRFYIHICIHIHIHIHIQIEWYCKRSKTTAEKSTYKSTTQPSATNPTQPIPSFPFMYIRIEWSEMLSRRLCANEMRSLFLASLLSNCILPNNHFILYYG